MKDRSFVPGRLYRDLDGSLVHLISVTRELCSWVAVFDPEKKRQATHRENFRRRFRSFSEVEWEADAAA